jgi:hypothetical protein
VRLLHGETKNLYIELAKKEEKHMVKPGARLRILDLPIEAALRETLFSW